VSERLTRHEIKQDPLVTYAYLAWDWLQKKWRIVAGVAGAIVAVVLVTVFIQRANARAEADARATLAEASTSYWQGDYVRTIQLADQVLEGFQTTRAANDARRMKGDALFWQGAFDSAATFYREYLAKDRTESPMRTAVQQSLAFALESAGKYAEAAPLYEEIAAKAPDRTTAADFYLSAARAHQLANQVDAARKLYEKVATEYKDTTFARDAEVALGELMAQGK
jgi:tetratricopeptide (TPR) repeat protein